MGFWLKLIHCLPQNNYMNMWGKAMFPFITGARLQYGFNPGY